MGCTPNVVTCVVVNIPATPWWLAMLQIFVPLATALAVAFLAYRFSVSQDRKTKNHEARLQIQRKALEDAQQALADYWFFAGKMLRSDNPNDTKLELGLEQAINQLTVALSRIDGRSLAKDVDAWREGVNQHLKSARKPSPLPGVKEKARERAKEIIHNEDKTFDKLCDDFGDRLRKLSPRPYDLQPMRVRGSAPKITQKVVRLGRTRASDSRTGDSANLL